MVKHTQTIRQQFANELFSVFNHLVGLALKRLKDFVFDNFVWTSTTTLH